MAKKDKKEDKKDEKEEDKKEDKGGKDAEKPAEGGEAPAEGAEGAEGEGKKSGGKKKKIIILLIILFVIGGGVGTALFLTGGSKEEAPAAEGEHKAEGGGGEHGAEGATSVAGEGTYVDLPDILVNLNATGNKRSTFLKLSVSLEVATPEDVKVITALTPRILDSFQLYLRNLRTEDLEGSAGTYRMREELLKRLATVAKPATVNNILIKEMLVQ